MKQILRDNAGTKFLLDTATDTMLWSEDVDANTVNKFYLHIGKLTATQYYYILVLINGIKSYISYIEMTSVQASAEDKYDSLSAGDRTRFIASGVLLPEAQYD